MSLEQALERNTEMMADLIRALEGFQPAAQQEAPPVPKLRPKADTLTTSEEKPSAATVTTTSTPAATDTIEYAQVAAAITSTFKIDRAKVVAALGKFGAAKGPQLKVEDYAAFLEELKA
jgi:hypothetical protein